MPLKVRIVFVLVAVACASMMAYGIYYLQEELGLEPCPMCILQRIALISIGVTALVAAIHGPRDWGLKVYSGLIILVATMGKLGGSMLASWWTGMPSREAAGLGTLMNTRGLMELVILNIGLDIKVISPALFSMMVLMALATTRAMLIKMAGTMRYLIQAMMSRKAAKKEPIADEPVSHLTGRSPK